MRAFLSYQTADKEVAGGIKQLLGQLAIEAFLAHEDINVSDEWRLVIIQELMAADLFIPILSKSYYSSIWCKQESGMAAYRGISIVPLSIDGSIPEGFIAHIQSTKIDPNAVKLTDVIPGLAKCNVKYVINELTRMISKSSNYRSAESNFQLILPYLDKAARGQAVELLNVSIKNKQVCHASLCAAQYLPPLFARYGRYMMDDTRGELAAVLKQYENVKN